MPGEFGDIIWKRVDPKTWELSNVPPQGAQPPQAPQTALGMTEEELANFAEGMGLRGRERDFPPEEAPPEKKREWRQQLRRFIRSMREDPSADVIGGVQELVENGTVWGDEQGNVFSAVPLPGERNRRAIVDAVNKWQDFQSFLAERYGTGNDPASVEARRSAWEQRNVRSWGEGQLIGADTTPVPVPQQPLSDNQLKQIYEARQLPDEEYKQRVADIIGGK
jgi:hypothetical protein